MIILVIAVIVLLALVTILLLASTKPDNISIQRVAELKAPPEKIFALISDFHHWPFWAPQDRMDKSMKRTFGGPVNNKGAWPEWESNGHAGQGRMEIVELMAPTCIVVKADFAKPFVAHYRNEFTLEPLGELTRLTWAMQGTRPFILKILSVFINPDQLLGRHFETGLQNIRTLVEQ